VLWIKDIISLKSRRKFRRVITPGSAQAAMEFLMTYGWALVVITVVIAAMSYFGILHPNKLLPDRCSFGTEFGCGAHVMYENGLQLRLVNNAGQSIIIDALNVTTKRTQLSCSSPIIGAVWVVGNVEDVLIVCDFTNAGFDVGNKEKLNIKITYHHVTSGILYGKKVQGEIFTVVQSGTITVSDNNICQNAEDAGLCDGLDILFGDGYKDACCSEQSLCCG